MTLKLKIKRRKSRKHCWCTCTKEPYRYQNCHKAGSVTPIAATFSCNGCNRQEPSICKQQNDVQAIPVPYRLHNYRVTGLLWSPYHVAQLSDSHLCICGQEPPLPHIIANKSFLRLSFWFDPFASENEFKTRLKLNIQIKREFSLVDVMKYQGKG